MKQIIIQTDKFPCLDGLPYEDRGVIITALMLMGLDARTPQQDDELSSILQRIQSDINLFPRFYPLQTDFDAYKSKYDSIVDRNRRNGAKGGRPRKKPLSFEPAQTTEPQNPTPLETQKTLKNGYTTYNLIQKDIIDRARKPTLEDVLKVAATKAMVTEDVATKFFYYYDSLNWMVGDRPILNWESKLMEWKNNQKTQTYATNTNNGNSINKDARARFIADATIAAIQQSQNGIENEDDFSLL